MIIKIYPDLRWEITDLKWIDPPTSYSLEYDVVRELDGLYHNGWSSNVIFLINKSREISPILEPNINWIMVNTKWYWRWSKLDQQIVNAKCPIPQKDIERCIVLAERVNKIDHLLNKKYED